MTEFLLAMVLLMLSAVLHSAGQIVGLLKQIRDQLITLDTRDQLRRR